MNHRKPSQIEVLFNSVEVELLRGRAFGNVPYSFTQRPETALRYLVKGWWNLYHESNCAIHGQDRTRWERSTAALNAPALLSSLVQIKEQIHIGAIAEYREITLAEDSAMIVLSILIN